MQFNAGQIPLWLFGTSLVIGAVDYFRGDRWQLGSHFIAGLRAFEPLFLSMAGFLVLIPFIREFLAPVITPLFSAVGIDPSVFAGLFLANDVGAYPLAHALTNDRAAADFSGMLLGSVFGTNLIFTLPAGLKIIPGEDRKFLFTGLLFGFITLPIGCLAGGLVSHCDPIVLLKMLIPVVAVAVLAGSLLLWPRKLARFLARSGRVIEGIALLGITLAILCEIMGTAAPRYLDSIHGAIRVVGSIVILLPGAYVFIALLNRLCRPFFSRIGNRLGINEISVLGIFTSLANSIPTLQMIAKMNGKGKTLNFAFLTAGAFAFGDHLAYCYAVAPHLAIPLLVTKFTAAGAAVLAVQLFYRDHPDQA